MELTAKPCEREGCPGQVMPAQLKQQHRYCAMLCHVLDTAMTNAMERDVSPEVWATLVGVADAASEWREAVVREAQLRATCPKDT